jgi:hypothetical protein
MNKKLKVKELEGVRFGTLTLLIASIVSFVLTVIVENVYLSTILLVLAIILFIIWVIFYFSLDEKIRKLAKKKK